MIVLFMGYVWMIKLIVIVQFLLSLEMFGIMGIDQEHDFHDFVFVSMLVPKILEIIGLSKNSKIFTVASLYCLGVCDKIS